MSAATLSQTPGINIDDRLRQVPGFSLFRRSSSVVANPTTQGVSLRGIGSSGASRTLILWDGVPMNDPFGGWVYWTRFPINNLRSVEISRGAATSVFGDMAMSGAIGLFSNEVQTRHLSGGYEGGSRNSQDVWAGYSDLWTNFALSGSGRAYSTDGYYIVPSNIRGRVDQPAGVRFVTGNVRLDLFRDRHRLFVDADMLAEERKNGTLLTHNSTSLGTLALHYRYGGAQDEISLLGFHTEEQFHSTFSSVTADRNTERLTYQQTVPSNANGGDVLWRHHGGFFNTVVGADVNQSRGFSTDLLVPPGRRFGGGTLLQHGEFIQSDFKLKGLQLFLGARHQFTGQDRQFFSPSAGLVYGRSRWRARGSVYRAFRSPTLNELYRDFRVGNTDTQPNAALRPETLFGAEAGADLTTEYGTFRVTAFRNSLGGLITNVTLSSAANQIVRQRQNAADALSRGFEFSAVRQFHMFRGEVGYLFADSRYSTRLRVAQVPRHQGSAQLTFEHKGTMVSAGVRSYSSQFDDDLNRFLLPGFPTAQAVVRQKLVRKLSVTFAMENALDRQFFTAFTPTPTIGAPRLMRAGLRWD